MRPFKKSDLANTEQLTAAWIHHCPSHTAPVDLDRAVEYYRSLEDLLQGYVIEQQGRIVGVFLYIIHAARYHSFKEASEVLFFIDPAYRSYRTAVKLLNAVEHDLRHAGVRGLRVGNNSGHRPAILQKLYTRRGYLPVPCDYYKEFYYGSC